MILRDFGGGGGNSHIEGLLKGVVGEIMILK